MKLIIFSLGFCLFALGLAQTSRAQAQIAISSASTTDGGDIRQQDRLNGQVRRVRVETVSLLVKKGVTVEGPRVVREITSYDLKGEKIDSVAYPAEESRVIGNKEYLHDAKGKIVEMLLRGDDGSILNKERYEYQFDEFGNWKQMTASIAVYENGKVGYEPFEITYRTITYYYAQPAPKVIASPTVSPISNASTPAAAPTGNATPTVTPISNTSTPAAAPAGNVAPQITKRTIDAPMGVAATGIAPGDVKKTNSAAEVVVVKPEKSEPSITTPAAVSPKDEAPKLSVRRTSEGALRKVSIDLPQPQQSAATTPAAVSPKDDAPKLSVLRASEGALRKASIDSPQPQQPAASPAPPSSELKTRQSNQGISDLRILQPGDSLEANPKPATDSPAPADSLYVKGWTLLASGLYSEAAEALRQATERDPKDAAAYAKLGIAYTALKQYQEAVVALKMAIKIKPEIVDAEAYFQLSNAYSALGKFPNALEAIKQATYIQRAEQANPEVATTRTVLSLEDLHYSTGLTYYNLRRYSEAIDELKQVVALNPKRAQAYYGLALSYIANGNRGSAEKQQETLEALDPVFAAKIAKLLSSGPNQPQGFGFVFKDNHE